MIRDLVHAVSPSEASIVKPDLPISTVQSIIPLSHCPDEATAEVREDTEDSTKWVSCDPCERVNAEEQVCEDN